jgi:hypothetical protein
LTTKLCFGNVPKTSSWHNQKVQENLSKILMKEKFERTEMNSKEIQITPKVNE